MAGATIVQQADYNRMIRLPHDGHYEELWRQDEIYDVVGVLGWNDAPVQRGRGSAIFLHVARSDYAPTDGCIALALGDLRRVLGAGVPRFWCCLDRPAADALRGLPAQPPRCQRRQVGLTSGGPARVPDRAGSPTNRCRYRADHRTPAAPRSCRPARRR